MIRSIPGLPLGGPVFVGVGTSVDVVLNIPGVNLPGVYKATDFLVRANVDMDLLPDLLISHSIRQFML